MIKADALVHRPFNIAIDNLSFFWYIGFAFGYLLLTFLTKEEASINRELILSELKRTREALNNAIAYIEAESDTAQPPLRAKSIKIGDGRAVAILSCLRDAEGKMQQRDFEDVCLRNCRTLVGAGGFIARGSIARTVAESSDVEYTLTEKGLDAVAKWESRYGKGWVDSLENPGVLGNPDIHDQQKVRLLASS